MKPEERTLARQVYDLLLARGPLTGLEIDAALKNGSAHKRLSELRRTGLVVAGVLRCCTVSGKKARTWEARKPEEACPTTPEAPIMPTNEDTKAFVREVLQMSALASAHDPTFRPSPTFKKMWRWLNQINFGRKVR